MRISGRDALETVQRVWQDRPRVRGDPPRKPRPYCQVSFTWQGRGRTQSVPREDADGPPQIAEQREATRASWWRHGSLRGAASAPGFRDGALARWRARPGRLSAPDPHKTRREIAVDFD